MRAPLEGIQTVSVAPGGAVITEFKTKVPGNYTLVDHALARAERGLLGILGVEGQPNPDIYNGQVMSGNGPLGLMMNSPAALRRSVKYAGPAIFSYGFRPFFLGGAAWAALGIVLWFLPCRLLQSAHDILSRDDTL
jgi:NnrS protein